MTVRQEKKLDGKDATDVLEMADKEVLATLDEFEQSAGGSVEDRAAHGNRAKELIRRIAVRESAVVHVQHGLDNFPELSTVAARMGNDMAARREAIDSVEKMSRGIQGINLNTGQDFDGAVARLAPVLRAEITAELQSDLPQIRAAIPPEQRAEAFPSGRYLRHHAPTNLSPKGSRWYERSGIVARLMTVYDHLRDFPGADRASKP